MLLNRVGLRRSFSYKIIYNSDHEFTRGLLIAVFEADDPLLLRQEVVADPDIRTRCPSGFTPSCPAAFSAERLRKRFRRRGSKRMQLICTG